MKKSITFTPVIIVLLPLLALLGYLVFCQLIPRYTYHLEGALPTESSLRSYYEKSESQQLQAILPLLQEIRDEESAKKILPEIVALSQGIVQTWHEHLAADQTLRNGHADRELLRHLANEEQTLLAGQQDLIAALQRELLRLRAADCYGVRHLEDTILSYVLREQDGEVLALWAPLSRLTQQWGEAMLHPSALRQMGEFFFPSSEMPVHKASHEEYEHLTVYLLSELYRHGSGLSGNSHRLYAPAGAQLIGGMSHHHEQYLYAITCFCQGLAVNELYELPSRQQSPLLDRKLERMRLLDLHRLSLAELRAHPRYVRDLPDALCGAAGGAVLLRLEPPCRYPYLAVAVDRTEERVTRVHFVTEAENDLRRKEIRCNEPVLLH